MTLRCSDISHYILNFHSQRARQQNWKTLWGSSKPLLMGNFHLIKLNCTVVHCPVDLLIAQYLLMFDFRLSKRGAQCGHRWVQSFLLIEQLKTTLESGNPKTSYILTSSCSIIAITSHRIKDLGKWILNLCLISSWHTIPSHWIKD